MASETNLRSALDGHLAGMPGGTPIDWENVSFDQDNQVYLSQGIFPAEDIPVGMEQGGSDVLAGLYQIMINVPKNTGKNGHVSELEKIKARFPRSSVITCDGTRVVIHKVFSSNGIPDDNYFRVPVSIRYRAV